MEFAAWIPFVPLISFLLLISVGKKLPALAIACIGCITVGISALLTAILVLDFNQGGATAQTIMLWRWLSVAGLDANMAFYVDQLTLVMLSVVTGVGFLIHVYAAGYMKNDPDFSRFLAYMNLFVVAMLLLVLGDNLILLYLGWEGVGLCSFLLIGFWYKDPDNVIAARKAFIVTRVGDTSLAIGMLLLFYQLDTLHIQTLLAHSQIQWHSGNAMPTLIALLLLGGAVGKSAQLPLQTWLPDAMAGPTPVSALIHAATMVTAGVYLIARMQPLYLLSPDAMMTVSAVGLLTLLLAGVTALYQTDIKRILAYSTMSQIGYMFLALGAGVWSAGIFHLMTHAFFKALLFLCAGSVIVALHHQQDIFKMGGLLKTRPFISGLFLIGLLALVAFPGTSGFVSKEAILNGLWMSETAGPIFWWGAVIGATLTAVYSFRLFFIAFVQPAKQAHKFHDISSPVLMLPLIILAILALAGGLIDIGVENVFIQSQTSTEAPGWLHWVAISSSFIGIVIAYLAFGRQSQANKVLNTWQGFFYRGFGFDTLYQGLFVNPIYRLARLNHKDGVDKLLMTLGWYSLLWHDVLKSFQTGRLRTYLIFIVSGVVLIAGGMML